MSTNYGIYVDITDSGMSCLCGKIYVTQLKLPLPSMILCPSCAVASYMLMPEDAEYLKVYRDDL